MAHPEKSIQVFQDPDFWGVGSPIPLRIVGVAGPLREGRATPRLVDLLHNPVFQLEQFLAIGQGMANHRPKDDGKRDFKELVDQGFHGCLRKLQVAEDA